MFLQSNFISLVGLRLMTLLLIYGNCCEQYYDFGHSDCAFTVNYIDSTCFEFNFSHCSWKGQVNNTWEVCTRQCCDSEVVYSENYTAIT